MIKSLINDAYVKVTNDQYIIGFDIACANCDFTAKASLRDSINNSLSYCKYNIDINSDSAYECELSRGNFNKSHINRVNKFFIKKNKKYVQDSFSHFIYELNEVAHETIPKNIKKEVQKHNFYFKQINVCKFSLTNDKSCYFLLKCNDCKIEFEHILTGTSNNISEMTFDRAYYYNYNGAELNAHKDFKVFKEKSCNDFIIENIL